MTLLWKQNIQRLMKSFVSGTYDLIALSDWYTFFALTTLFTPFFLNISEKKRVITLKIGAKCAYELIFWYFIKNSNLPKRLLTTLLHSADALASSTGDSIQLPSTPAPHYTLPWSVQSLNMPLPPVVPSKWCWLIGLSSGRGLHAASSCRNGSYPIMSFSRNLSYQLLLSAVTLPFFVTC